MIARRAAASLLAIASVPALASLLISCGSSTTAPSTPHVAGKSKEEIGKYIMQISGCHDCHTPGIMQGTELKNTPEGQWLTGSILGFNGPWGTSYAANLRQKLAGYPTEQSFIDAIHKRDPRNMRPPMPWSSLQSMTDDDLGAVYAYVRSLGKGGDAMPDPLPPGVAPQQPFLLMVPGMAPPFPAPPPPASGPAPK